MSGHLRALVSKGVGAGAVRPLASPRGPDAAARAGLESEGTAPAITEPGVPTGPPGSDPAGRRPEQVRRSLATPAGARPRGEPAGRTPGPRTAGARPDMPHAPTPDPAPQGGGDRKRPGIAAPSEARPPPARPAQPAEAALTPVEVEPLAGAGNEAPAVIAPRADVRPPALAAPAILPKRAKSPGPAQPVRSSRPEPEPVRPPGPESARPARPDSLSPEPGVASAPEPPAPSPGAEAVVPDRAIPLRVTGPVEAAEPAPLVVRIGRIDVRPSAPRERPAARKGTRPAGRGFAGDALARNHVRRSWL